MPSKPPFFRQERSETCMLACLRMLLAHQGTAVSESALVEQVSLEEGGLDPDVLARLAKRNGLPARARQLDLTAIRSLIDNEQFPIVLVDRTVLDDEFAIHAVIPVRFTRQFVVLLDPLRGERRVSIRKFEQAQRRVAGWADVCERQRKAREQEG